MKKRNISIDIAKGIGIMLVILGHLDIVGQFSRDLIYSFHMPLFFLLSGIFLSTKQSFAENVKKSLKTLVLPFVVFFVFDFFVSMALDFTDGKLDIIEKIKDYALALCGVKFYIINTPIWFLLALFFVRTICYFVNKNRVAQIIAVAVGVGATIINPMLPIWHRCLPLVILPAISFYVIGSMFGKRILSFDDFIIKNKPIFCASFLISIIAFVVAVKLNKQVDLLEYSYGNPVLFFVAALSGIYVVISVSNLIALTQFNAITKPLSYFGENSIYILVWHYYFCRKVFPPIVTKLGFGEYMYSAPTQIIGLIITLVLSVVLAYVFNNWLYFLFGKTKAKKYVA